MALGPDWPPELEGQLRARGWRSLRKYLTWWGTPTSGPDGSYAGRAVYGVMLRDVGSGQVNDWHQPIPVYINSGTQTR